LSTEDDTLLKCLIDLAESTPKYLRQQLDVVFNLCLKVCVCNVYSWSCVFFSCSTENRLNAVSVWTRYYATVHNHLCHKLILFRSRTGRICYSSRPCWGNRLQKSPSQIGCRWNLAGLFFN